MATAFSPQTGLPMRVKRVRAPNPYFSYARPEAHPREPQPVDEGDGYPRSADPDRPDGVSDGGHRLPARCGERASLAGTPPCQMAPPVRERRPPVGTAARRAAGGSLPSAFRGRRHGARSAANGVRHSNVRITPNAGIPAEKEPPRNWGSFPPPAFGGLCRPEVGVPLPARRSAWWHGRHAQVQRPPGAFCDSASAPEVEKSGLTHRPRVPPAPYRLPPPEHRDEERVGPDQDLPQRPLVETTG